MTIRDRNASQTGPGGFQSGPAGTTRGDAAGHLNPAERAFLIALARWKARIDIGEQSRCLGTRERHSIGDKGRIRTYDLDTFDYFCEDSS
jgi:hypothetical protein